MFPEIPMAILMGFLAGLLAGRRLPARPAVRSKAKARPDPRRGRRNRPTAPASGSPRANNGDNLELYVGNLSYEVGESQLRELFGRYGQVDSVRMIVNKFSNKSKGYAFVRMRDESDCEKAMTAMNGKDFEGRKLVVNQARNKDR